MVRLRYLAVLAFLAALSAPSLFAESWYHLPQAAAGVSGDLQFVTQLSISNPSDQQVAAGLMCKDNSGETWQLTIDCPENDAYSVTSGILTEFIVPAKGQLTFKLSSRGQISAGWVRVATVRTLRVSATYGFYKKTGLSKTTYLPLWEAAVLPAPSAQEMSFVAHRRADDTVPGIDVNTGYAVSNPNLVDVSVTATAYDEAGTLLETKTFTVPQEGHVAQFINELFTADLTDFHGLVRFSADAPIACLAMKESKNGADAVYSTVPIEIDSKFNVQTDYDMEPNSTIAYADHLASPVEVRGTVGEGTDSFDYYGINLNAGHRLEVALLAGSIGSGLLPVLTIRDQADNSVGSVEALLNGTTDLRGYYTAPESGSYYIRVGSSGGTQGPKADYRLIVWVF